MENPYEVELNAWYLGTAAQMLKSAEEVESFIEKKGTKVVFIDASCGCAGETARPVFLESLKKEGVKPDFFASVFPPLQEEAFECFKEYFLDWRDATSPGFYLYRDHQMVYKILDSEIELCNGESLKAYLESLYDKYAGASIDEKVSIKAPKSEFSVSRIEADRLYGEGKTVFVDCRSKEEREANNPYENSRLLTPELVEEMIEKWDKNTEIVFYCARGIRSMSAVSYFEQNGFTRLKSLDKGVEFNHR